ncbi:MAG TPA: SRPBCC family protein [Solirubrobacteraceae bacterium]|nr:SRPBCC family protein [Solirubrobacteraceae bacterium]
MATVRATAEYPAPVHEAEACWYDTKRWPVWVDQLDRVISVDGGWPKAGARVIWESGPAGRGRVSEHVVAYEPLRGQTLEVEDDSIRGSQTVSFSPEEHGVAVELALDYELKKHSPVTWLVDLLFIRRLMAGSLRSTLGRFGTALETSRGSEVG